jgi:death-on-curing protein
MIVPDASVVLKWLFDDEAGAVRAARLKDAHVAGHEVVAVPEGQKEAEGAGGRQGFRRTGERVHRDVPARAEGAREEVRYLTAEQVLFVHVRFVSGTGGMHGGRDVGLLRSAVERPRATFGGKDLCRDLFHKAGGPEGVAHRQLSVPGRQQTYRHCRRSPVPGLERIALTVSQKELETFTLDMALKKRDVQDAAAWYRRHSRPEKG